jgi:hypothetical protein
MEERRLPFQAAAIGHRLLAAGRADEALAVLERAKPKRGAARAARDDDELYLLGHSVDDEWEETYIEALEATGEQDEAQQLRWAAFAERLSVDRLRAYLKRLPDFDDVEAEERAMKHALGFTIFAAALGFFVEWPNQVQAAQLVLARPSEINGNLYYLLDPAAQLIESKHPLAATLLRRARSRTPLMVRSPPATSTPPDIFSNVNHSQPVFQTSRDSRRMKLLLAACEPNTAGRPASGGN